MAADPGYTLEAWTMPSTGTFTRKCHLTRAVSSYTLTDQFNGSGSGTLTVADDFTLLSSLLVVDESNHANDEGSVVRLLRNGTPLLHFPVISIEDVWQADDPTAIVTVRGMDYFLDTARVLAYDYPASPSTDPDWIYGAPTILRTVGGEISNELQEIWRGSNVTSGTFTITDGSDTTAAIAWNATASTISGELELFAGITEVRVRGDGALKTPWEIEFVTPATYGPLSIGTNSTDGDISVSVTRDGGTLDPRPWTKSYHPVTGEEHGNYQTFQIVQSPDPVPVGDTYALKVDADDVDYPTDYAGAQQIVNVTPGATYRASCQVYTPASTGSQYFRLVVRDMLENLIAVTDDILVLTDTWTTLTIPPFQIPAGVSQVIFRVGILSVSNIGPVYVGVESALLARGFPADTLGGILNDLLVPVNGRGVLTWLTPTWSDSVDSAGAAWDQNLSWQIKRGQSFLQLLEYAAKWGYEWRIRWDEGQTRFEWDVWNPSGGGTNLSTSVFVGGRADVVSSAPIVRRLPDVTYAVAEGDAGRWGEYENTTLSGAFGRLEGYFGNRQGADSLTTLATEIVSSAVEDSSGRRVRVIQPRYLPWGDYRPGDTITLDLSPKDTKQALRVAAVTVSMDGGQATPEYDIHLASLVLSGPSALAATVTALVRRFQGLDNIPQGDGTADYIVPPGGGGKIPFLVAASDSDQIWRDAAVYLCDGADDQIEIQAALDAAAAANTGGKVTLAPGYYQCEFTGAANQNVLTVPTGVTLAGVRGYFYGAYVAAPSTSTPGSDAALVRLGVDSHLRDIILYSAGAHAVRLLQFAAPIRIADCWIEATGGHAIIGEDNTDLWILDSHLIENGGYHSVVRLAGNVRDLILRGCQVQYGDHGVDIRQLNSADTPGRLMIEGNYIVGNGYDGIRIDGSNDGIPFTHIRGNRIMGQGAVGLSACAAIHLIGYVDSTPEGAYTSGIEEFGTIVAENIIEDTNTGHGIWLDDVELAIIADNSIEETDYHGILIEDGNDIQIHGNLIWATSRSNDLLYDGIHITDDSDRCHIRANTIRRDLSGGASPNRYAIRVNTGDCDDTIIVGNDLRDGYGTAPISDAGTGTTLSYPGNPTYGDNFIGAGGPAYGGGLGTSSIGTVAISLPAPKVRTDKVTPAPVTVAVAVPQARRSVSKTVAPAAVTVTVTVPQATA